MILGITWQIKRLNIYVSTKNKIKKYTTKIFCYKINITKMSRQLSTRLFDGPWPSVSEFVGYFSDCRIFCRDHDKFY